MSLVPGVVIGITEEVARVEEGWGEFTRIDTECAKEIVHAVFETVFSMICPWAVNTDSTKQVVQGAYKDIFKLPKGQHKLSAKEKTRIFDEWSNKYSDYFEAVLLSVMNDIEDKLDPVREQLAIYHACVHNLVGGYVVMIDYDNPYHSEHSLPETPSCYIVDNHSGKYILVPERNITPAIARHKSEETNTQNAYIDEADEINKACLRQIDADHNPAITAEIMSKLANRSEKKIIAPSQTTKLGEFNNSVTYPQLNDDVSQVISNVLETYRPDVTIDYLHPYTTTDIRGTIRSLVRTVNQYLPYCRTYHCYLTINIHCEDVTLSQYVCQVFRELFGNYFKWVRLIPIQVPSMHLNKTRDLNRNWSNPFTYNRSEQEKLDVEYEEAFAKRYMERDASAINLIYRVNTGNIKRILGRNNAVGHHYKL